MPNLDDLHNQGAACHRINQTVIAGSDAPRMIGTREFYGAARKRYVCERCGEIDQISDNFTRQFPEFTFR